MLTYRASTVRETLIGYVQFGLFNHSVSLFEKEMLGEIVLWFFDSQTPDWEPGFGKLQFPIEVIREDGAS